MTADAAKSSQSLLKGDSSTTICCWWWSPSSNWCSFGIWSLLLCPLEAFVAADMSSVVAADGCWEVGGATEDVQAPAFQLLYIHFCFCTSRITKPVKDVCS